MHRSVAYRLWCALVRQGLAVENEANRCRVGLALFALAELNRPVLRDRARGLGVVACLMAPERRDAVAVAVVEPSMSCARVSCRFGDRLAAVTVLTYREDLAEQMVPALPAAAERVSRALLPNGAGGVDGDRRAPRNAGSGPDENGCPFPAVVPIGGKTAARRPGGGGDGPVRHGRYLRSVPQPARTAFGEVRRTGAGSDGGGQLTEPPLLLERARTVETVEQGGHPV
ncbi:hypothetical protein [Streptomyces sp. UH6]|uniref:hypothetical protein n=1 Tax=Streptomyces sp. UH6 TaxID=2748379 RepID=UPI0015D4D863|nr:hypothetical protein [Streptomyces sp. UH6]NYV72942.1 hypothetical protein [Streptomyces sp. UH6]